jgi:peptidyl-prolyl cis-trans isomerase SurA
MKNLLIITSLAFFGLKINAQVDPVVLEINGKPVTKSEFLQIYLKNNNDPKYDKESIDEYLEMFKKFKLKVAEAEALGYDTIPKLKKELEGYKKQLANPYLIDSAENKSLVLQAYERIKTEVRASHILVKVEQNASPKDTLAAYNRILGLKARIEKGEDFASVAKMKNGSEDPSAVNNGGDLGFFTAFQMVYPFEEKAYTTPVGSISDPFRTRYGYHILKVTDKRPARGTIKVAHIMVATGKAANTDAIANAEKKSKEIYDKLTQGSKWEEMVSAYSDDPGSSKKNGELPAFGSGTSQRMVPVFEEAAFSLKNDGDFSKPIQTEYGFHIIKRLEWKDIQPFEAMKKELQSKVNKDERSKKTQDSFVEKLKKQYNFKLPKWNGLEWFEENLDSTYFLGKWSAFSNQDIVKMEKESGIYKIPCSINGLGLKFIFDTGASDVSISLTEALFMLKNGYLKETDIKGKVYYSIANGEIAEGTKIILQKVEVGKQVLYNVEASIVHTSKAPLLFGQSAMEKFGKFTVDYSNSNLIIGKGNNLSTDLEVFNLDGKSYTQKQFASYLEKSYRGIKKDENKVVVQNLFKNWVKSSVLEYEESKLVYKYPDFKALVNEYHDGIILYEVMSDKVWNKANKDTAGLKKFFEENREKYLWPKRLDAEVYECNSAYNANLVYKMMKKKSNTSKEIIEKVNATSELNLKVKLNKFDQEQTPYLNGKTFILGRNKPFEFEGKHYVIKLIKELPVMQKEFNEARGSATSDYQNFLEKTWLEELNKKYTVKVNYDILYNLNKK